jgi:hypothetical protein
MAQKTALGLVTALIESAEITLAVTSNAIARK